MKKYSIYIGILFISLFGFAQQGVSVLTEIDTTQIRIGEQFQYKITTDNLEKVVFPELSNLGSLEVVSSSKVDTLQNKLVKKYQLTGFDSGSFYIPKQQIFLLDKAYFTDSLLVHVATVSVDTLKQKAFPIKPILEEPMVFDDYKPYFIWLWLFLALIVIALTLYYFYRKYYKEDEILLKPSIPAYQEAIEKFASLDEKQLWQNNKIKEYYTELTEIVRTYIGREVEIQTLEATTDEVVQRIAIQNEVKGIGISKNAISKLETFLKHADFVKFAKLRPMAEEIQGDRSVANDIIESLQPIIKSYELANTSTSEFEDLEAKKTALLKKKRTRKVMYIVSFVLIAIVLSILAYQTVKPISDSSSKAESEIVSENWKTQSFGNPPLTLYTPYQLSLVSDEIPQQVANAMRSMAIYSYENADANFTITVNTNEYVPQLKADVELYLQGGIQSLEKQDAVENLEYDREPVSLENGMLGTILSGKMKVDGNETIFKMIGFAHENYVWTVMSICGNDDEEKKEVLDTILNSITIEIE